MLALSVGYTKLAVSLSSTENGKRSGFRNNKFQEKTA
jgi:hypothetical protein